jgi:SAM-dependent methyltransferase
LFGIPDFRLEGDPYLSLEDERAKAGRLHEYGQTHSFSELVDFYYSITDDVPPDLAAKFVAYVHHAPARMKPILSALGPASSDKKLLDLGCATGGALVAGENFALRVGVDIALRWLVICQKRLDEIGIEAQLVCADVRELPFRPGQFSHIIANDLIEHVHRPNAALASSAAQLADGGKVYVSASNRWWPGPHPAVGIWGAGLMPKRLRSAVARKLKGIDVLRNVRFVSASRTKAWLRAEGLAIEECGPKRTSTAGMAMPTWKAALIETYCLASGIPGLRQLMVAVGPAFDVLAEKRDGV